MTIVFAATISGQVTTPEPGVFIIQTAEGFEVQDSAGASAFFETEGEARAEAAEWLTAWADDSEATESAMWAERAARVLTLGHRGDAI